VALAIGLPLDLPPVGIITLRQRRPTPAAEALIGCLRRVAGEARRFPRSKRQAR